MKPTELQIGDYVKYQGQIYFVEEISAKGWVHLIYPDTGVRVNMTSDYIIDLLEPIPLTYEILKANGFSEHAIGVYTYNNICVFFFPDAKEGESKIVVNINCSCSHKDGSNSLHSCDINYVHELKNALRLCGLSELADNFKIE